MFALLRRFVDGRLAIIGGIAYQAAPYHLVDFYVRGALAECTAYVFVPLVILGMTRLSRSEKGGAMLLSLSYAGLIYSHLPTTVLFSSVLPAFAIFLAFTTSTDSRARAMFLLKTAALLVLGMAVAAAYLVPALALLPYMSERELWAPVYQPQTWLIWNFASWPLQTFNSSLMGLAFAMFLPAAFLLATRRSVPGAPREMLFWAGVTVVSLPVMLGLIPWYWQIDPISKVQFPFRLMLVCDFAFVFSCTLYVAQRGLDLRRLPWAPAIVVMLAACVPLAHTGVSQLSVVPSRAALARATWEATDRDFDGFVPPQFYAARDPGLDFDRDRDPADSRYSAYATRALPMLEALPQTRLEGTEGNVSADVSGSKLVLAVNAKQPGAIVLRRFYFPDWIASDQDGHRLEGEPTPDGLVRFSVPAGTGRYVVAQDLPPSAQLGLAVSAAALLALVIGYVASRGRRNVPVQ
jgi:hypothetical protein